MTLLNPAIPTEHEPAGNQPRPEPSSLGPLIERFDYDVVAERQIGRIRGMAAVAAGVSGLWLAIVASHWLHGAFSLAAAAAAFAWWRAYQRARDVGQARRDWHLAIRQQGLECCHGDDVWQLAWTETLDIEVDEERLVVLLRCKHGGSRVLDPVYRSGGIYGLYDALREARQYATARESELCQIAADATAGRPL